MNSLAKVWVSITMIARRFPPPWSAEVTPNCFVVAMRTCCRAATGLALIIDVGELLTDWDR
jgi:hypothetical protein